MTTLHKKPRDPAPMPMHRVLATMLTLGALLMFALSTAAQEAEPAAQADPRAEYQSVELTKLVPSSRMTDGTRAIFAPRGVRFKATLQKMPEPQKADYLKQVMGMMGITAIGEVNRRVVLAYGGGKPLAAYVEEKAAQRIEKELKQGGEHEFYAFHVYNNRYGPALVIVSFEEK